MNKLLAQRGLDTGAEAPAGSIVSFFETLRAEQEKTLKSLRQAAALLDPDSGQLAAAAASHVRLTQRFFDAQRGLLRQRASVDAEIARLRSDVAADALRVEGAAASLHGSGSRAGNSDLVTLANEVGVALVESDEVSARAHSQLGGLLDSWWADEVRHGRDRLDDAQARAAMVNHLIEREAETLLESTTPVAEEFGADAPHSALPGELVSAFSDADEKDIDALLHDLVGCLGDDPAEPPAETSIGTLLVDEESEVDKVARTSDGLTFTFDESEREAVVPRSVRKVDTEVETDRPADDGFWTPEDRAVERVDGDVVMPMWKQLAKIVLPVVICTLVFGLLMVLVG